MMKFSLILKSILLFFVIGLFSAFVAISGIYLYLKPELPSMEKLQDVRFQIPLRVYTYDKNLIAEFGEKRRTPIKYEEVPDTFVKAVLAAEDANFFKHAGVDIKGLSRAVVLMVRNRGSIKGGGGSTITMQLTRALFLTKERKFKRKFKEIILAYQIENELSKEEILELYFNEIYLGKRAYGIQAAANVYYDKNIDELSLAQQAMIAGLPKAPATNNPVNNPAEAMERRNWILGRMLRLGFISKEQHMLATSEPLTAKDHGQANEIEAPYLAELVRQTLYQQYGDEIYTEGYKAYSTITSKEQTAANQAIEYGIHTYNERHGYKGVIKNIESQAIPQLMETFLLENENAGKETVSFNEIILNTKKEPEEPVAPLVTPYNLKLLKQLIETSEINFDEFFKEIPSAGRLEIALCLLVDDENQISILMLENGSLVTVDAGNIIWAAPFIDRNTIGEVPEKISQVLKTGDVVYLRKSKINQWRLAQLPEVQSAMVAIRPQDGAVISLVGGYDHRQSKFNRAVQGARQAGSSFKPFIYTKALESGFTAATIVNDAPVVFEDAALEETWKPENSGGKFYGPTRIRQALYRSRNLVSIRVLRSIGIRDTIDSLERFGFEKQNLPNNLSLALGSASLNTMQVASAFSTFANGGYQIYPYYLDELQDRDGNTVFKENPVRVCPECPEPLEEAETISGEDIKTVERKKPEITEADFAESPLTGEEEEEKEPEPRIAQSVIDPRVNFIIDSMLADVIKRGTGRRALALGRDDIRGKTGTTNDQFDAWFTGYNNDLVASVWIGFDSPQTLGRGEFGAVAALPIWLDFMELALAGSEQKVLPRPDGLVTVKINSKTGEAAKPGDPEAIFEIFREEYAPQLSKETGDGPDVYKDIEPEQIF